MRNGFPTAVVAMTMAGLLVPAAAEAHHVAGGSAQCTLVGNVPTIKAQASFVGFASYNKPIAGKMDVDGKTVATVSGFSFSGANGTWQSDAIASTPGSHHVSGQFTWPHQDGMNGSFSADVSCPTPPSRRPRRRRPRRRRRLRLPRRRRRRRRPRRRRRRRPRRRTRRSPPDPAVAPWRRRRVPRRRRAASRASSGATGSP